MRFEDIKNILLIVAAAAGLTSGLARAQGQARANVVVPANVEWTDSGLYVVQGDRLRISGEGAWSNVRENPQYKGPEGWGPDVPSEHGLPLSALIARIGDAYFLVGKSFGGLAPATGTIFVGMNDSAGTHGDNLGEVKVGIFAMPARMPELRERTSAEATAILRRFDRTADQVGEYSENVRADLIFAQNVEPGTLMQQVGPITVTFSLGPHKAVPPVPIPMPNVVNRPYAEAEDTVRALYAGNIAKVERDSTENVGVVFNQDPEPGTDLRNVNQVVLYASTGGAAPGTEQVPPADTVEVPLLIGLTKEQAEAALHEVGLRPFTVADTHRGPTGFVYDQTPGDGQRLARDGQVSVYVSMPMEIPWTPIGGAAVLLVAISAFAPKVYREHWIRRLNIEPSLERDIADVDGLSAPAALFSIGVDLVSGEAKTVGELRIERTEVLS